MEEKDFQAILEQGTEILDQMVMERLQYVMDFGEISIQYDFCLN